MNDNLGVAGPATGEQNASDGESISIEETAFHEAGHVLA